MNKSFLCPGHSIPNIPTRAHQRPERQVTPQDHTPGVVMGVKIKASFPEGFTNIHIWLFLLLANFL